MSAYSSCLTNRGMVCYVEKQGSKTYWASSFGTRWEYYALHNDGSLDPLVEHQEVLVSSVKAEIRCLEIS